MLTWKSCCAVPINASIFLNGTASYYQFEIEDLQAALDAQFSTPNSQVSEKMISPLLMKVCFRF
jgi:hypothetical protein